MPGAIVNNGVFDFIAGSLSYSGNLVVGTGGLLGANLTLNSDRQLSLTGTTTIDATRMLFLSGGALHTGALVNNGTVASNFGTLITGSATLAAGSKLQLNLGGTTRNTQYGTLAATGSVNLDGALIVTAFYNVFPFTQFFPVAGESFDILDWGTRSGAFSTISLPGLLPNLSWDTSQLYTTGVISVIATAGVAGDYNSNGVVDAADYIAWRNNQGTTQVLPNDPIGGTIGAAQYNQWRTHFGQTAGSGTSVNVTVPEPATLTLLVIAAANLFVPHRRA